MGGQIKAVGAARPRRTRASTWSPALANEFQVRTCRRAVELVLESIFVYETIEADRRRIIRGGKHGQTACRSRSAPSRYLLWTIPLFAVAETFPVLRTRRKLPS